MENIKWEQNIYRKNPSIILSQDFARDDCEWTRATKSKLPKTDFEKVYSKFCLKIFLPRGYLQEKLEHVSLRRNIMSPFLS